MSLIGFGTPNSSTSGGGLFGQPQQPSTGGLFSTPQAGSAFGVGAKPATFGGDF